MSEYQYYEFRAVDRPLAKDELAGLRAISSRATITPTRFVNVYNYGDFRGDPPALMETYFDIFVYIANWGTHQFMLRLPRHLLDPAVAMRYCMEEGVEAREAGDFVILDYRSEDEGGDWIDDDEGPEWMTTLLPVRAALAAGDLRPLYLGWLSCLWYYEVDDETDDDEGVAEHKEIDSETVEPPVPPGLRTLPEELKALAHFLRVDEDLIEAAAQGSADLDVTGTSREALERWIGSLPESEKDTLLLRLVADGDATLQADLLQRFRRATAPDELPAGRRTIRQLLAAARQRAEERKRREAEHAAREHARKQREAAAARSRHLDRLAGQEPALRQQVDALIATKRPTDYDQAVTLLEDLRDLAARAGQTAAFAAHLDELRAEHARKPSFIQRLDRAKLGGS
jgi:hypothetical protein